MGKIAMTIPDDIHARGKAQAAYKGISWQAWVVEAIRAEVERQEAERERERRR